MPGPNPAKYRIPRVIHLPFGVRIKVRQLGKRAMQAELGDADACGAWIESIATIFLKKSDSPAAKRDTLYHEIQHAVVDLKDAFLTSGHSRPTKW